VRHDADPRLLRRGVVRDRSGAVRAPVVDDDDLPVVEVHREELDRLADGRADVLLLVEREDGERERRLRFSGHGRSIQPAARARNIHRTTVSLSERAARRRAPCA
jgi:hypothetical protein